MPYDPKWQKPADVFSLESLIAWLEKQPADGTYCYIDGGNCLIHRYLTHAGIPVDRVCSFGRYNETGDAEWKSAPTAFWKVSIGTMADWTFGAALVRARAALKS